MDAVLLGGPEHGRIIHDVTRWPIMTVDETDVHNLATPMMRYTDAEPKKHLYHERTIKCFNKYTKVGVHSDLTDGTFFAALGFTTFLKESYHSLFESI